MRTFIIYKGAFDQWQWREVDENHETLLDPSGKPHSSSLTPDKDGNIRTRDEAIAEVMAIDPSATVIDREAELEKRNAEMLAKKQAERGEVNG